LNFEVLPFCLFSFEERFEELTDNFEETEANEDEFSAGLSSSFALADQEEILTV